MAFATDFPLHQKRVSNFYRNGRASHVQGKSFYQSFSKILSTNAQNLLYFQSFTKLFSMFIEGGTQISTVWLQCYLLFSIVWGLCSSLVSDSREKLDLFLRNILLGNDDNHPKPKSFKMTRQQLHPERGTVFDWVFDKRNNGSWISWMDTMSLVIFVISFQLIKVHSSLEFEKFYFQPPLPTNAKISDLIIQTSDMSMQRYFLSLYLPNSIPVMFVGPTGTGKSTVVLNYMLGMSRDKFVQNSLNFSARTTAGQTQDIVMSKLDRRRRGVFGPAMGKK